MNERIAILMKTIVENQIRLGKSFEQFEKYVEGMNTSSLDPVKAITDIREMGSMQMIEEILKGQAGNFSGTPSDKTIEYVLSLKHSYNARGSLSESQRFHLETTMSSFRNNSES